MNSQLLYLMDPISIIGFLHVFKMACDNNGTHEGAAMWLIPFFMKKTAAAAITARPSLKAGSSSGTFREVMLIPHVEVVNHLVNTYATDDIIAEA